MGGWMLESCNAVVNKEKKKKHKRVNKRMELASNPSPQERKKKTEKKNRMLKRKERKNRKERKK